MPGTRTLTLPKSVDAVWCEAASAVRRTVRPRSAWASAQRSASGPLWRMGRLNGCGSHSTSTPVPVAIAMPAAMSSIRLESSRSVSAAWERT